MNLLFITPAFYPATYYGGPIYSTYYITKILADNGIKISVVTTNTNGDKKLDVLPNKFIELKRNLFVKYYGFADKRGFSPYMFFFLWNDIRKADIIYLVSIFSPPTPLTLILSLVFRKKIILSPRGQLGEWCLNQGNRLKKLWIKLFIKPFIQHIVWDATSYQEKELILKVFPKAEICIIPSVIDLSEFSDYSQAKDYSIYKRLIGKELSGKIILISLGRLHKVKGFDILISAFDKVKNEIQGIYLLIGGKDFGEQKDLEAQIKSLGLEEKVFFVGYLEGKNRIDFLSNADLFALPSHHENFGMVYAEAMAAGLPIIASKNTPWEEIEKYECGKWVDNNPNDFAAAILEVLSSNYKQMGLNGKRLIKEKYDCDKIVLTYKTLFENILLSTVV